MTARIFPFPGVEQPDSFPLKDALVGIEQCRAPNIRIRKQLMLEMLQKASIAIYRGEFERAEALLSQCRTCLANTIKRQEDK